MAIVALQALIYFAILDRTVGSSRWLGGAAGRKPFRVAVLRSENASKLNPEHPERYFDLSKQWEGVLAGAKTAYRTIDDKTLARGLGDSADVLVLPWAVCLDDSERRAIQLFVESGKGLVLSRYGRPRSRLFLEGSGHPQPPYRPEESLGSHGRAAGARRLQRQQLLFGRCARWIPASVSE